MRLAYGFFILMCCLSSPLTAQQFLVDYERYGLEQGMPDRTIWDITTDSVGLVWMATGNGLSRFDGYSFSNISSHPKSRFRIPSDATNQIHKVGANEVLIRYRGRKKITWFNLATCDQVQIDCPKIGRGKLSSIQMPSGLETYYAVQQQDSFFVYQWSTNRTWSLLHTHRAEPSIPHQIYPLPNGTILHQTEDSFETLSTGNDSDLINNDRLLERLNQLDISQIRLIQHSLEYLWVITEETIHQFHYDTQLWKRFPLTLESDPIIYKSWVDDRGNILLGGIRNPERYPDITSLILLRPDGTQVDYSFLLEQIERKIIDIYSEDFQSLLWFGTHKELYKVHLRTSPVQNFLATTVIEGTFGATIRGIEEAPDSTIYFAREIDYWYRYFPDVDSLASFQLVDRRTLRPLPSWQNGTDIISDGKGGLWGTLCFGNQLDTCQVIRFDLEDELVDRFPIVGNTRAFGKRSAGGLWLALEHSNQKAGIYAFDPDSGEKTILDWIPESLLTNGIPLYIKEIDSRLFVGMYDKLIIANLDTHETTFLNADQSKSTYLGSPLILTIQEDLHGRVLLGTVGGIDIYEPESQQITHVDRNDGLSDNRIAGIIVTPEGDYWVSTFKGINFINGQDFSIRQYSTQDGFSDNEFNRFSFEQGIDGRLYFGGINGINIFHAEDLMSEGEVLTPILTNIEIYDSQLDSLIQLTSSFNELQSLRLSPYVNYIEFDFAMPSFIDPKRHQYQHWLEGVEREWIHMGQGHTLRYNQLPPGGLTLRVRGADGTGKWSENPLTMKLIVEEVFYKTLPFQLIMLAGLAGLIYGILRFRYQQRIRREQLRTKISSDLHDEVSGLLAGIAMQSDLLGMLLTKENLRAKAKNIGEETRSAMSKLSDVLWSIDARKDSVENVLNRMHEHLNGMLRPLEISYRLEHNLTNLNKKMQVDTRQNFYLIFKEAINNVAKHSNASEVRVEILHRSNQASMVIKDNGRVQATHIHAGQGRSNMKMRAEKLGGNLEINQEDGFQVRLTFPSPFG